MEKMLVQHCAPTLANLKTANLLNCELRAADFKRCKKILAAKGVEMRILSKSKNGVLIYVFRRKRLENDLKKHGCTTILKQYGYSRCNVDECICRLCRRIHKCSAFPHEIGLFLGYPPEDVRGFIEHKGQDFKLLGYWKVYCNKTEAMQTFTRYKKCVDIYTKKYTSGTDIEKLTVSA